MLHFSLPPPFRGGRAGEGGQLNIRSLIRPSATFSRREQGAIESLRDVLNPKHPVAGARRFGERDRRDVEVGRDVDQLDERDQGLGYTPLYIRRRIFEQQKKGTQQ